MLFCNSQYTWVLLGITLMDLQVDKEGRRKIQTLFMCENLGSRGYTAGASLKPQPKSEGQVPYENHMFIGVNLLNHTVGWW